MFEVCSLHLQERGQSGALFLAHVESSYASDYGLNEAAGLHPCAIGFANIRAALKKGSDAALLMEAATWRELIAAPRVVGHQFVGRVLDDRFSWFRGGWKPDDDDDEAEYRGGRKPDDDDADEEAEYRLGYINQRLQNNFGEYAEEVRAAFAQRDKATLARLKRLFLDKIMAVFSAYARPASFLTRNPGEQHTASFQPIAADTANWYGRCHYRRTWINFPSPEHARACHLAVRRLPRRRHILALVRRLPRDMRRMIVGYMIRAIVQHQLGEVLFFI